ncbi:unnamed protein product [Coregonus sp. 'balchen']|nr:unnamed protein product [Coregonus sp. 'balchen']
MCHSFLLSFSAQTESRQSLYKHDSPEDGDVELNLVYSTIQLNTTTQSPQRSSRVPIPDEGVHYAIVDLGSEAFLLNTSHMNPKRNASAVTRLNHHRTS